MYRHCIHRSLHHLSHHNLLHLLHLQNQLCCQKHNQWCHQLCHQWMTFNITNCESCSNMWFFACYHVVRRRMVIWSTANVMAHKKIDNGQLDCRTELCAESCVHRDTCQVLLIEPTENPTLVISDSPKRPASSEPTDYIWLRLTIDVPIIKAPLMFVGVIHWAIRIANNAMSTSLDPTLLPTNDPSEVHSIIP